MVGENCQVVDLVSIKSSHCRGGHRNVTWYRERFPLIPFLFLQVNQELRRAIRSQVGPSVSVQVTRVEPAGTPARADFSNDAERRMGQLGARRRLCHTLNGKEEYRAAKYAGGTSGTWSHKAHGLRRCGAMTAAQGGGSSGAELP